MKQRIMIVEDDYGRAYTMAQVLRTCLRIPVQLSRFHPIEALRFINPHVCLVCPNGGSKAVYDIFRKRCFNRRNVEVSLILAEDLNEAEMRALRHPTGKECDLMAS